MATPAEATTPTMASPAVASPLYPLSPACPAWEPVRSSSLSGDTTPHHHVYASPPHVHPRRRVRQWRPTLLKDLKDVWHEVSDQSFDLAPPPPRRAVLMHTLSGTLGSLLVAAAFFPVETIKIHIQTASPEDPAGFLITATRVLQRHGLAGLYRGLSGTLIKEGVHSLNFWLWHTLFNMQRNLRMPGAQRLLRTLAVKQLNWLCTIPFEVVANWQLLSHRHHGVWETARFLHHQGGFGTFYRGLRVSLLLAVNPAIMSVCINLMLNVVWWFKIHLGPEANDDPDIGKGVVSAVSAFSKVVALSLTYPLIRAKVLQQTSSLSGRRSLADILVEVASTQGPQGLYRGFLAMSYQTLLHNSLMTLLKYLMRPWRIPTPPPSPLPEHAAHWLLRKMPHVRMTPFAREPFPADVIVQRMDRVMERWKDRRHNNLLLNAATDSTGQESEEELEDNPIVIHTPQGRRFEGQPTPLVAEQACMRAESIVKARRELHKSS